MMLITLVGVGELLVASYLQAEVLVACSTHIYTTRMNGVKCVNVYASNIKGIHFPRDCIRFTVCRFAFDTPTQRDIIVHTVLAVQIISVVLTPSSIL